MAVVARSGLLLDETNFLHHTNHKTGQHPKTDDIGKTMIETLLKDHQKSSSRQKRGFVMTAILPLQLMISRKPTMIATMTLQKLNKTKTGKTLTSEKNDAPVRKVEGDKDSETPAWWKVELPNRMRHEAEKKRCCEDKPSR